MVHLKSASLLVLLFILFVFAKCVNKDNSSVYNSRAAITEVKCSTMFGRTIASESKNNYTFNCKYIVSNYNIPLDNQCLYSGEAPKTSCSATDVRTPESQLIFNIINCISSTVLVNIKAKIKNKRVGFPLQCEKFCVSGLQCKGSIIAI